MLADLVLLADPLTLLCEDWVLAPLPAVTCSFDVRTPMSMDCA